MTLCHVTSGGPAGFAHLAGEDYLDEYLAGTWCGGMGFDEFQDIGGFADGGDLELTHARPSGGLVLSDDV
jgi:hypothetical protein